MKNVALVPVPGILFLVWWQYAVQDSTQLQFFFSTPLLILKTFYDEIQTISLWQDIFYTGFAAVCGLTLGTIAGSALGLSLWVFSSFERISRPYITIIGAVPIFAIAPMLILWFGIGLWSKIMMAAFAVFLVAATQAYEGAKNVATHHLLFAQSLGASKIHMVRHIILPGALHWVITGIRMNIGIVLVGTFIAEFISAEHGLGHYILKAGSLYDMSRVFTGIILLGILSLILQTIAMHLHKKYGAGDGL